MIFLLEKLLENKENIKKISLESGLKPTLSRLEVWQGYKDSNLGHAVLETAALPTELHP